MHENVVLVAFTAGSIGVLEFGRVGRFQLLCFSLVAGGTVKRVAHGRYDAAGAIERLLAVVAHGS